jgi:hypothetical protein
MSVPGVQSIVAMSIMVVVPHPGQADLLSRAPGRTTRACSTKLRVGRCGSRRNRSDRAGYFSRVAELRRRRYPRGKGRYGTWSP